MATLLRWPARARPFYTKRGKIANGGDPSGARFRLFLKPTARSPKGGVSMKRLFLPSLPLSRPIILPVALAGCLLALAAAFGGGGVSAQPASPAWGARAGRGSTRLATAAPP